MKINFYSLIIIIFFILCIFLYFGTTNFNVNISLLIGGNFFLMVISVISYFVMMQNAINQNSRQFINKMMASTMIRFFACIIAATSVIYYFRKNLQPTNIYILMVLYFIYTFLESYYVIRKSKTINK